MLAAATAAMADPAGPGVQLRARFEWAALPEGGGALVLLGLGAAVLLIVVALYRRERAASAAGLRWVCCGLRVLCLGAMAAILLRPSIARDVERVEPGLVVVLADRSASMSVRDGQMSPQLAGAWAHALDLPGPERPGELRRHDLARAVIERDGGGLIADLSGTNQVELVTFATAANTVLKAPRRGTGAVLDVKGLPAWSPTGGATDLADALRAALQRPGSLAAVVVLTDGRQTAGGDADAVGRQAAERGVPLYFVGIGSPSMPKNVALVSLESEDDAVAGLPLKMTAAVRSDGYAGETARLVLTATEAGGDRTEAVLSAAVTLRGDARRQEVDLTHVPPAVGTLRYAATVEALPGEFSSDDNVLTKQVTVAEEKVKVLLVAGGPTRDYRFLKALLEREPTYELTAWAHGAAAPAGVSLPRERRELMQYRVVMLCDPSPEDASVEWLDTVGDLVDSEGLGLAYLAGPTHSPELLGGATQGTLRDLLPVAVDTARTRALIGTPGYFTEGWPVELAEAGLGHSITRASPGLDDARFWSAQPGLFWSLPVEGAKSGAAALLRWAHPEFRDRWGRGMIVAAVEPYGLGRVFFCGSPGTWRWRRRGIEHYERFWLQVVRHCAGGRLAGAGRRARIALDRSVYQLGQPVRVNARLYDARFRALDADQVALSVKRDGVEVGTVSLLRTVRGGDYDGVFYAEQFGRFDVAYTAPDGFEAGEGFEVRQPDLEFRDPRMDAGTMERLASATGGRVFGPADLGELPGAVPDLTRVVIEPGPLRPVWDAAYVLALLIGALGVEWMLRKRMGLL